MRKILATLMMMAMMAVMIPLSANAQTTRGRYSNRNYSSQSYNQRYNQYKKPNVYDRHRNLFNVGIGAGAGALIGAIAGGGKGAAIGALIGGGGGAVYTYGIKPKKKYYRRY